MDRSLLSSSILETVGIILEESISPRDLQLGSVKGQRWKDPSVLPIALLWWQDMVTGLS